MTTKHMTNLTNCPKQHILEVHWTYPKTTFRGSVVETSSKSYTFRCVQDPVTEDTAHETSTATHSGVSTASSWHTPGLKAPSLLMTFYPMLWSTEFVTCRALLVFPGISIFVPAPTAHIWLSSSICNVPYPNDRIIAEVKTIPYKQTSWLIPFCNDMVLPDRGQKNFSYISGEIFSLPSEMRSCCAPWSRWVWQQVNFTKEWCQINSWNKSTALPGRISKKVPAPACTDTLFRAISTNLCSLQKAHLSRPAARLRLVGWCAELQLTKKRSFPRSDAS